MPSTLNLNMLENTKAITAIIRIGYNKLHKTNFTWQDVASWNGITDPNKIYPGQVLNFTNPQQNTAITGANQSEGNPDAALENAATVAAQAQTIIQGQQAGAQTDVNNEVVAGGSGGDGNTGGDGNGGSTGDGGGTSLNGSTVTSVGMTLTEDQKKDLKKQKILVFVLRAFRYVHADRYPRGVSSARNRSCRVTAH